MPQVIAVAVCAYAKHPHLIQLFVPYAAVGSLHMPATGEGGRGRGLGVGLVVASCWGWGRRGVCSLLGVGVGGGFASCFVTLESNTKPLHLPFPASPAPTHTTSNRRPSTPIYKHIHVCTHPNHDHP